jgi:hypothetical protein
LQWVVCWKRSCALTIGVGMQWIQVWRSIVSLLIDLTIARSSSVGGPTFGSTPFPGQECFVVEWQNRRECSSLVMQC